MSRRPWPARPRPARLRPAGAALVVVASAVASLLVGALPAAAAEAPEPISVDDAFGRWQDFAPHPFHAYRIYYPDEVETENFDGYEKFDTPGPNFMEKPNPTGFFAGTVTSFFFNLVHLVVFLGTQVLRFGYGIEIAEPLAERAFAMSMLWKRDVLGPLGLEHLALMITVAFGLLQATRGRLARALIDFLIACLVFTLGLVYHDQAPETQKNMVMTSRGMSLEVLGLVLGEQPWPATCPQPKEPPQDGTGLLLAPVNCRVWHELVRVPWEVINFGQLTTPGSACGRQLEELLANPQAPNRREVRKQLYDAGCQDLATYNYNIGFERPVFALMTLIAAVILTVVFIAVALTLLIAQLTTVGLLSVASVAFFMGLFPALARLVFFRWLSALFVSLTLVVVQSAILALGLWLLSGALGMADGLNLFTRFLLLDVVAITILFYRRRLTRAIGEQINTSAKHAALTSAGEMPEPAWMRAWPDRARIGAAPLAAEAAQEYLVGRRHRQLRSQLRAGFASMSGAAAAWAAADAAPGGAGAGGGAPGPMKDGRGMRAGKAAVRKGKNPAIALGVGAMAVAGSIPLVGVTLPAAVPAIAAGAMGLGVLGAARGTTRAAGRTTRNAWKRWQQYPSAR